VLNSESIKNAELNIQFNVLNIQCSFSFHSECGTEYSAPVPKIV